MKVWKRIGVAALAMIMAAMPTTQAMAATSTNYLSDIRVGYGDEGKTALENAGYTVWKDLDANKGGSGTSVWLGYKSTTDVDDAITDVAVMNMEGGYSFDAYTAKLDELNANVDILLARFADTITEFRANYEAGNPYTQQAVDLLNGLYDEDITTEDGAYMGIGNLFLDAELCTEETLHTIFFEANTDALIGIESALALGCIEVGDSTVLTRLEQVEYPDNLDASRNTARTYLAEGFDNFRTEAEAAVEAYDEVEDEADGSLEQWLEDNGDENTELENAIFVARYKEYQLLDTTAFGADEDMTLLDFALLDKTALTDEYLDMLAQALTPGQVGLIPSVGIMEVLVNASTGESYEDAEDCISGLITAAKEDGTASVFYRVDRDLLENPENVAMTSEAIRAEAASGSKFAEYEGGDYTTTIVFGALTGAAALISVGSFVASKVFDTLSFNMLNAIGGVTNVNTYVIGEGAKVVSTTFEQGALPAACSPTGVMYDTMTTACQVAGYVAFAAMVVFMCIMLIEWGKADEERGDIIYTPIPRAIVELADDGRSFIPYYAAKLITAEDGETDTLKIYGDLNAQNKDDEWLALYYTKDTSKGSPITTDMLVKSSADTTLNTNQYTAIHKFGENVAANLNEYNSGSGKANIYVYLRTSTTTAQSGSVFTTGTVLTGVVAFLAGGGIAAAATYTAMRKKKVEAPTAA